MGTTPHKVLLADADRDELAKLAELVEAAGHEVVALTITPGETGDAIVEHKPTMAMILIEGDEEHAVDLMVEIRSFADIPLVVMARQISDSSLRRAANQALEVLHMPGEPETVAKVIETAATRFDEWRGLERRVGEFDGILIARRYGLEQTQSEIAETMGGSQMRVSRRLRAVLGEMGSAIGS